MTRETPLGSSAAQPLAHSLPAQIAERIGDAIIDGSLLPGARLKEAELALHFAVSRAPVREALRILEGQGLIRLLPQRGAQVTALTVSEVEDLFELRAALFGIVARRLVARVNDEDLERFGRAVDELGRLSRQAEDGGEYAQLSYQLSLDLAAASGSDRLLDWIRSFSRQTTRYTRLALSTKTRRLESARNWRAYVRALKARDAEEAIACGKKLVEDAAQNACRALKKRDTD